MTDTLKLVAFKQESAARLLVEYLRSQEISARYLKDESEFGHQVILLDIDRLTQAEKLCQEFLQNPADPKYQDLAWQSAPIKGRNQTSLGLPVFSLRNALDAPFTWMVFAVCCLVYALSWLGGYPWVEHYLKIIPLAHLIEMNQWWRILTPALIHFSVIHIVFNLIWWGSLGKQIEQLFGTTTLILLFIVTAALSNIAQLIISGPNFGGLSGVVYGTVGFVWIVGWLRPDWGIGLPKAMIGFLLGWLLLGYVDVLWVQMANTAHTVGLLSGCAFAALLVQFSPQRTS